MSVPGVFFAAASLTASVFGVWFGGDVVSSVRQGMSTDYRLAAHHVVWTLGLAAVSGVFGMLALGVFTFRSNSLRPRSMSVLARVGRGAAYVLVAVVSCFAAFLVYAGAGAGIAAAVSGGGLLLTGCGAWVASILYERHRDDQATFRVGRWLIRMTATAIGLWAMAGAVSALVMGDVVSGIPQLIFSVLLLRQAFGGLMMAGQPMSSE